MPYFKKNIVTFAARNSARIILKRLVQHRVTINTLLYIITAVPLKSEDFNGTAVLSYIILVKNIQRTKLRVLFEKNN